MTSAQDASPGQRGATDPAPTIAERLARLRHELAAEGLTGFLVPRADEHQGEYVPASAERLAWITGFSGSAGSAIILGDRAAIFVDGRYTLQVRDEVDGALFERLHSVETPPQDWLARHLVAGDRLGFDPWTHTVETVGRLKAVAERAGATLVPTTPSPLDRAWRERPAPPKALVTVQDADHAGESAEAKRMRIAQSLADARQDAVVLALPDSIAWLLNIRGEDVPHTPFALSFAILRADGTLDWFIDPDKLSPEVRAALGNGVRPREPEAFGPALDDLGAARARVRLDPAWTAQAIATRLTDSGALIEHGADPVQLPKAIKNPVEIEGTRRAHRRDGAALVRFLAWLAREAPTGTIDELTAAAKLRSCRAATGLLRDLSFDTISGAGPNGAIVHYRSSPRTNRMLAPGELYLVDSGGQYRDGTTDVTRTVAIGPAGSEERDRFTRVLKGHIALATTLFPEGTTGSQLDVLARHALWQAGLDYDHGTGHGVGSYLSVHEGPHRIAKPHNPIALRPGMIVSNEPGYYKTGAYGIRIENLIVVTEARTIPGGDRPMMGFETLTLAPIDRHLIAPELLSPAEIAWLDAYHARVRAEIAPLVDGETSAWLAEATRPILAP